MSLREAIQWLIGLKTLRSGKKVKATEEKDFITALVAGVGRL